MNPTTLKRSLLLSAGVVLALLLSIACGDGQPQELEIAVRVEGAAMSPETIKVKQGDTVTLKIQVEEAGEFHLHTYDIEREVEPAEATDLFFVADATGRFGITFHPLNGHEGETHTDEEDDGDGEGEEIDIGFLEVRPR